MQQHPYFMSSNRNAKLVMLFSLAALLLTFPLLGILGEGQNFLGIPNWYIYIFVVWLVIILFLRRIIHQKEKED
ncbi:MAG: hypothetical protein AAF806_23705 [Bacteroidota bacterium]